MERSVWEELLGNFFARCVRGAVLISTDGEILKSTLSPQDEQELATRWIAGRMAGRSQQLDIKTDSGWILAAPVNKRQILVVVIDSEPYTRFNLDLIRLFADDSASDDDSRLADPIIMPQPPKQDGAHVRREYVDPKNDPLAF
jgi:predicted regulator of Ras-like GTPase activity (Roadblock/LC7/MglB family)